MLRIVVHAIGKDKDRWVTEGLDHFEKLLKKYCILSWNICASPVRSASLSPTEIRRREATALLQELDGFVVALADNGRAVDSHSFATMLERWQTESGGTVHLVIGGPHGLDDSILARAKTILSLSPLTLSHQVVRLVLMEQLFRGFSILHNTDYHK